MESLLEEVGTHKITEKAMPGGKLSAVVTSYEQQLHQHQQDIMEGLNRQKTELTAVEQKISALRTLLSQYPNDMASIDALISQATNNRTRFMRDKQVRQEQLTDITQKLTAKRNAHAALCTEETQVQQSLSVISEQLTQHERNMAARVSQRHLLEDHVRKVKLQLVKQVIALEQKVEQVEQLTASSAECLQGLKEMGKAVPDKKRKAELEVAT